MNNMYQISFNLNLDAQEGRNMLRAILDVLDSKKSHAISNEQPCSIDQISTETDQSSSSHKTIQFKEVEESQNYNGSDLPNDVNHKNYDEMKQEYEGKIKLLQEEISRIQREKEEEKGKMNTEISVMKKEIQKYNPAFQGINDEISYLVVKRGELSLTNDEKAPYCANFTSQDKITFQFNYEKGPSKEACKDKENLIRPFCEIEEEQEGATEIRVGEWGIASYDLSQSRTTRIEKKAKVRLIKP